MSFFPKWLMMCLMCVRASAPRLDTRKRGTKKADTGLVLPLSTISCFFIVINSHIVMGRKVFGIHSTIFSFVSISVSGSRYNAAFPRLADESCFFGCCCCCFFFFFIHIRFKHITFLPNFYFHLHEMPIKTRITYSHRHVQSDTRAKMTNSIENRRNKNNAKPFDLLVGIATEKQLTITTLFEFNRAI